MGGGGAMRAAAKIGSGRVWGIVAGGTRHGGAAPNFNPAGVFWPVMPVFVSSSSPEADVKKPCKEVEGWVLADTEPAARLVFGPVVTMKEAQEATSELKEALDQLFLLSPTVVNRFLTTDAVPNGALRALRLLSQSTDVQNVVASLACDPHVRNAVLNNPALVEFVESQRSTTQAQEKDNESGADSGHGFADVVQSIKLKLLKMFSTLSKILQSIYTPSDHKEEAGVNSKFSANDIAEADGNCKFSANYIAEAAPLLGLALLVMMVVLLKRA